MKETLTHLEARALGAFFRNANNKSNHNNNCTAVEKKLEGKTYIVITETSKTDILSVYRVRMIHDRPILKCLKRPPKELFIGQLEMVG